MTGYVRREYPEWSWSISRQQTFASCQRRYYYHYYGSHNGWEFSAEHEAALAYRLKKLTNLYMVLGDALHKSAQQIVEGIARGRAVPRAEQVEEEIRRQLRRVWRSSRDERDLFVRRPNRVDMLREFYYQMAVSDTTLEKINQRIGEVSKALVASGVWGELALQGTQLVACEQFDTFLLDQTPVYAVPDLLYKSPDGVWIIVDWKTGDEAEDNRDQVALYALYVHEKHGVPPEWIRARLEYLSLNLQSEMQFSTDDLRAVAARARASMKEMQELLADPSQNAPKSKDAFALTDSREQCPWCSFYELCQEELELSVS
ncbi:MAG: PD-(D/E)XK nuclease family protein [Bacillota bacterium]|jgi:predicted RecB family nuclease|nr:PD-(D/E)XK nuclease family protein [Bacillota bacterium]HHT90489.1 PD-(D/E)XK nuclease family protein [Bacillota bacterium]